MQVEAYGEDIGDQNRKPSTIPFPLSQPIIITSVAFWQPLPMIRLQKTLFNKHERKTIPSWAWKWVKAVKCDSLTDKLLNCYLDDTIGIYYASIDNIIFKELSGPNFYTFTQTLWENTGNE